MVYEYVEYRGLLSVYRYCFYNCVWSVL